MSGTSAVNSVDARFPIVETGVQGGALAEPTVAQSAADSDALDELIRRVSGPQVDVAPRGLGLPAPAVTTGRPAAAALAQVQERLDVAGFKDVLGRYQSLSRGDAAGYPSAVMAAAGVRDGGEFATYIQGQRVTAPEAAILSASGTPRNADIGTSLQDYRVFIRYQLLSPTGAAVLASARTTTGADYDTIYERYRGFAVNAYPEGASLALATAELESGRRDADSPTSAWNLRTTGFHIRDAGIISAMALRYGQSPMTPTALAVALRLEDVPDSQRNPLVAIGVASRRTPAELSAAYRWFASNGAGSAEVATMLTAGWAMQGRGDPRGLVTALAARTSPRL